jgi:hypothetical protein
MIRFTVEFLTGITLVFIKYFSTVWEQSVAITRRPGVTAPRLSCARGRQYNEVGCNKMWFDDAATNGNAVIDGDFLWNDLMTQIGSTVLVVKASCNSHQLPAESKPLTNHCRLFESSERVPHMASSSCIRICANALHAVSHACLTDHRFLLSKNYYSRNITYFKLHI